MKPCVSPPRASFGSVWCRWPVPWIRTKTWRRQFGAFAKRRRPALRGFACRSCSARRISAEKAEFGAAQLDAWRTIQRAHAIANGVYVAAVNRVGFEGPADHGLEFWGSSFIADPFGQLIAEASVDKEEILIAECDPRRMED